MPMTKMDKNLLKEGIGILTILSGAKITKSNAEARRLIEQKGIALNGEILEDSGKMIFETDLKNKELIIRKGKKTYHKIVFS